MLGLDPATAEALDIVAVPLHVAIGDAFKAATDGMVDDPRVTPAVFVLGCIKAHAEALASAVYAGSAEAAGNPILHAVARTAMVEFALGALNAWLDQPIGEAGASAHG